MKSPEVYRLIRDVISPWCKARGFKRTKSGMLGWYKPIGQAFLVFWFQCSMDGWDEYAGSQFIVEFQLSQEQIIGVGTNRNRISSLLDGAHLEQVRRIQNEIISKLSPPPKDHYALHISPDVTRGYLAKFKPVTQRYQNSDDIWFRYRTDEDVRRWAIFVLDLLPEVLSGFVPNIQ